MKKQCQFFSYLNGTARNFTKRDQNVIKQFGFRAAFSQINGFNKPGEDPYSIKRVKIGRSQSLSFQSKITGIWGKMKNIIKDD